MLTRTTPLFRLAMLGFLLLFLIVAGALHAEAAEPTKPRPPALAGVVRECGHVVAVYFTDAAGATEMVLPTTENAQAIIDLVNVSERVLVYNMDCTKVGHDSVR